MKKEKSRGELVERELTQIFKALANKRRVMILRYLKNKKMASVGNIAEFLKLSLPSTSKHLNILYSVGILDKEQQSLQIYYRISPILSSVAKHILSTF